MSTIQNNPFINDNVLISKFTDRLTEYEMTMNDTPWLQEAMDKITSDFDKSEFPENCESLDVSIKVKKDSEGIFGEYLWAEGSASGQYYANCIKCLKDIPQSFDTEFKGVFINSRLEKDPDFEELDEVYINGQMANIYFHERGKANISDIIKEVVFLAVDHYPLHDPECKGLCHTCGIDLNNATCAHTN